jgi:hypothetical protein
MTAWTRTVNWVLDTVRFVMAIIEVTSAQQPFETLKKQLLSHF